MTDKEINDIKDKVDRAIQSETYVRVKRECLFYVLDSAIIKYGKVIDISSHLADIIQKLEFPNHAGSGKFKEEELVIGELKTKLYEGLYSDWKKSREGWDMHKFVLTRAVLRELKEQEDKMINALFGN
jgi:hypothetical protein